MKLRIKNNSIRLRLTQSEVRQFRETGSVEEIVEFGADAQLIYRLAAAQTENIHAQFDAGKITVSVPAIPARNWTESSQIGLEDIQSIGASKTLKILIEKDFACLERADGEDESDAFPHPKERAAC